MTANDTDGRQHRPVRSFVKRAGRMTSSQQQALRDDWPTYGLDYRPELLDLDAVFSRQVPRVLEIGFGNGESLVELATQHPDRDFLGIEVHDPGVGHCLIAARKANVSNLRLIVHDAIDVLKQQIPPASLSRINLYFPDPWPKKRHHKRRIVQPAFLELCARALQPDGCLHIATDWAGYADHIDDVMKKSSLFRCDERREHDGDQPLDRPMTKFEKRGLIRGYRITDWRFRRA